MTLSTLLCLIHFVDINIFVLYNMNQENLCWCIFFLSDQIEVSSIVYVLYLPLLCDNKVYLNLNLNLKGPDANCKILSDIAMDAEYR